VIGEMTDDTLVENSVVRDTEIGVRIKATARGTLLRGNVFKGVRQEVLEERPRVTGKPQEENRK
jgi:nitrous oxidase accessory protein NosD